MLDLSDHLPMFCITIQETEAKTSTEKHIQIINEKSTNKLIEEMNKENWKDIMQLESNHSASSISQ